MADTPHYLQLAYLAEISIVFNLAYIELKWKEVIKEVKDRVGLTSLAPSAIPNLICKNRECERCEKNARLKERLNIYEANYLSYVANMLYNELSDEQDNHNGSILALLKIWSFSECKWLAYPLWIFHVLIRKEVDRILSVIFLVITTIILAIITMIDGNLMPASVIKNFNLWNYIDFWMIRIFLSLALFTVVPACFWLFWRKFLEEYECLTILLTTAYQRKSKKKVSEMIASDTR